MVRPEATTKVVSIFLLVSGVNKTALATAIKPLDSWAWLMFGGVLDIVLGLLILLNWTTVADWIVGLLFGVSLLVNGWWLIMIGWQERQNEKKVPNNSV